VRRLLVLATLLAALAAAPAHAAGVRCDKVSQPKPRANGNLEAPKHGLDARKSYSVTLKTNCGSFTFALDVKHSPHVAASFVALVRAHFFDRTVFHRIVPGFVIQGGDPTASGTGGPGYETHDRVPASARYTLGVVAMAKTAADPAGTSGSQFFVVTAADAQLPPEYALLGKVTKGLSVVQAIGRLGDPATEQPTQVVEILEASVRSS
jgi:cyclophilin family peptidyl-prolyl cis-trans isomerase